MYSTKSKVCRCLQQRRPNLIRVRQDQIESIQSNQIYAGACDKRAKIEYLLVYIAAKALDQIKCV